MKTSSALFIVTILAAGAARAGTPPAGFADREIMTASVPTALAYEPGSGNVFVVEKGDAGGNARVLRRDSTGAVTTAVTLACVDSAGERGLLGIAFDPDYLQGLSTRWVYLYYTRQSPATGTCAIPGDAGSRNRVVRLKEAGGVLSGEQLLLEGPVLGATNHNGGTLRFAPDKTLFVSVGDNDTDLDAVPASRNLNDLRGKILRINRDGSVPNTNPFAGQIGVRGEIWAWGLRNPFRFSIDPTNGIPWIGDVGESSWEEIDKGVAGADYGYPCFEGNVTFHPCNPAPANPLAPALVYGHFGQTTPFTGETVIGGPVYRSGPFGASYEGRVFFGDYVEGWIRSAAMDVGGTLSDVQMFIPDAGSVVDIIESPAGCLAYIFIDSGSIREVCRTDDFDGDGFTIAAGDCDDTDPTVYPGAPELCDGKDNDCAGGTDDKTCADFGGADAVMNGLDLALLGRNFGSCAASAVGLPGSPVDFNHDGCIDGEDLAVMAAVWGCSGTAPICH